MPHPSFLQHSYIYILAIILPTLRCNNLLEMVLEKFEKWKILKNFEN